MTIERTAFRGVEEEMECLGATAKSARAGDEARSRLEERDGTR